MIYRSLGEAQKALEKFNEALPISRAIGDRSGEAVTLNNIGTGLSFTRGDAEGAGEVQRSSAALRAVGDRNGEATRSTASAWSISH